MSRTYNYRLLVASCLLLTSSFLVLIATHGSVFGFPSSCRTDLLTQAARAKPPVYSVRAGGYCDGNVPVLLSGEIELIVLTFGSFAFPSQGNSLHIPRPVGTRPDDVIYLHGTDRRAGSSYRLDALIPEGGLDIDLTPAIRPLVIGPSDLGLIAWRSSPEGTVYLPINISNAIPDSLTLAVRMAVPGVRLEKQICIPAGECQPLQVVKQQVKAGEVIEVPIPSRNGLSRVQVALTLVSARGTKYSKVFIIAVPSS